MRTHCAGRLLFCIKISDVQFFHFSTILLKTLFLFQTCYEMERYLKDEPKMKSYKKLSSSDRAWYEVNCLDDFTDRHYDALSSGSSPCSWDGALSCAILVKQEPLDIIDDEDDDSSSFESPVHSDVQLRLVARNSGTLTPPSSPESGQGVTATRVQGELVTWTFADLESATDTGTLL